MRTEGPAAAGGVDGDGALAKLVDDPSSRKQFLRMVGGTGAAAAFATLAAACGETTVPVGITQNDRGTVAQFGPGDIGIVNYALMLEYMEEDFYGQVLKSGEVSNRDLRVLLEDTYANEKEHTRALERVAEQMGRPIRRPKTDFDKVIEGGERRILEESAKIENHGAAAYLGQAPRIADRQVLASALSIHTVEARQGAAFNEMARNGFTGSGRLTGSVPDGAFARPMTMEQILERVKPFLPRGIPDLDAPGA